MTAPDVFAETRVVNPPRLALVRSDAGVWTVELLYWLRDFDGQWWGHVETVLTNERRVLVPASHLEPVQPARVEVWLDDRWRPGRVLGWRTSVDGDRHLWEALVEVRTEKWRRMADERLWFKVGGKHFRGAEPPAALPRR
ncbi:MAG TPA: hypothetical protein VF049_05120 [Nocardioidaceae bacterium]